MQTRSGDMGSSEGHRLQYDGPGEEDWLRFCGAPKFALLAFSFTLRELILLPRLIVPQQTWPYLINAQEVTSVCLGAFVDMTFFCPNNEQVICYWVKSYRCTRAWWWEWQWEWQVSATQTITGCLLLWPPVITWSLLSTLQ